MLSHGYNKVTVDNEAGGVIADGAFYPFTWLENNYIFYNKICRKGGEK